MRIVIRACRRNATTAPENARGLGAEYHSGATLFLPARNQVCSLPLPLASIVEVQRSCERCSPCGRPIT